MGDLTKNISRSEIECKCGCGTDTIDSETVKVVQGACDYFAKQLDVKKVHLVITSGIRCKEHNSKVGGSNKSQHIQGRAIDFVIVGIEPSEIYHYLDKKYTGRYGAGDYETFTHLDTKTGNARRWSI
tara:strand:- start:2818 stop:3198 length:381 start_codon:yes stop_codon:yes gene_type:complete